MHEPIQVDQWTAIRIDEHPKYGYALQEGYIKKDGSFQVAFCKREFGKQGEKTEKNVPMSIKLGDKDKAIAVLQELLDNLAAPF